MELRFATWPEVERYLEQRQGIIVPIGSTEQHGPTGLLGTDAICAEVIAAEVGRRTGALVAPTINVGMAQHHLAFPGTISLRPTTLISVILDIVSALHGRGFERFFFINAHGGNTATLRAAFSELYAQWSFGPRGAASNCRCESRDWWDLPAVAQLAGELYGADDGVHATASEIALTLHAWPEHAKQAVLDPQVAPAFTGFTTAQDYRMRYADGRIGSDPDRARADHGRRLLEAAVTDFATAFSAFETGA